MRRQVPLMVVGSLTACLVAGWVLAQPGRAQTADMDRVQNKVRQVQEKVPQWIQAGGDVGRFDPLAKQLDRSLKAGQLKEAEETLDEILRLVGPPPGGSPQTDSPAPSRTP